MLVLVLVTGTGSLVRADNDQGSEDGKQDGDRSLFEKVRNLNKNEAWQFLLGVPLYSDDLDYSMRLGGRIHMDTNQIQGVYTGNQGGGSQNNIYRRRLAIYLQGLIGKNWDYKAQLIGDENQVIDTTGDMYVNYHGQGIASLIRIGKAKEPMGLEQLTTSNAITTTERTAATSAFAPDRNFGVTFYGTHNQYKYGIGVYHNDTTTDNSDRNFAITGRAAKPLINQSDRVLHFGGSFSYRLGDHNRILLYPEVREVQQSNRISSGSIEVDVAKILNLELIYIQQAFHLSAETYAARYEGHDNDNNGVKGKDVDAFGSYITAGYFLTGEVRPYNDLYGGFNIIVPKNPSLGAWEVFARLSHIDLQDNGQGNEASLFTSGVNWYISRFARVMLDYSYADYDQPPSGTSTNGVSDDNSIDSTGHAVTMRLQFAY